MVKKVLKSDEVAKIVLLAAKQEETMEPYGIRTIGRQFGISTNHVKGLYESWKRSRYASKLYCELLLLPVKSVRELTRFFQYHTWRRQPLFY